MSEQLDNELKKRIIEAFDDYEDTSSAHEGWELLRQKFPAEEKDKKPAVWWWRGMAAAVLVALLSLFTWMYLQQHPQQQMVKQHAHPGKDINLDEHAQPQSIETEHSGDITAPLQQMPNNEKEIYAAARQRFIRPAAKTAIAQQPVTASQATTIQANISSGIKVNTDSVNANPIAGEPQNSSTLTAQAKPTVARADTPANTSTTTIEKLLATDSRLNKKQNVVNNKAANKSSALSKKVLYSVYAGTFFNYADGSRNQVNAGAGFSADIKLVGNLKLSTGLAIARNSFSYDNQAPNPGILQTAMALNSARHTESASNRIQTLGFAAFAAPAYPVVSTYQISLTGFDVPVNLKYEFNPIKTDAYVSAGLSSGTFFNESYRYTYSNANSISRSTTANTIPDAGNRASFARFDFARMLNLAVGVGYQLNNHNRLVIEPFLKYPLDGMGSQQLRFGAGGINLKLKFQTSKK